MASQQKKKFRAARPFLAMGTGASIWTAAALVWQFSRAGSERGRSVLMGFLLLLLVGGMLLLVLGIRDLLLSRQASKRTTAAPNRKKAA